MHHLRQSFPDHVLRRVGTRLKDRYTILRVLGYGGMATVYQGQDERGNNVALKVLHEELSVRKDIRTRFVREGYAANSIGHPGVVRILDDYVDADGVAFLAMELLEGETLGERRKRLGGKRPCQEVLVLGYRLLDVLDAAHAKNIVHRDIKPENLFLTHDGFLKVLDFGIARVLDEPSGHSTTKTGTRLGTPAFMPPEQALGRAKEVDGRSDLWSAAATLFTLLTGETVHLGETPEEIVIRCATQPARSLAHVLPDAPPSVAAIIDRALRFSRDERWSSALDMKNALREAYEKLYATSIDTYSFDSVDGHLQARTTHGVDEDTIVDPAGLPTRTDHVPTYVPTHASLDMPDDVALPPLPVSSEPASRIRLSKRIIASSLGLAFLLFCGFIGLRTKATKTHAPPETVLTHSAPVPMARECSGNQFCIDRHGGKNAICRKDDGVCVLLEHDECEILAEPGDVANDATVWIGAMYPYRTSDPVHFGSRSANVIKLARRDFAQTTGGLPPIGPGQPVRPIGVVLCDDEKHPREVAEHLVNNVHVPAILGFALSEEVLALARDFFLPRRVLALAANTSSNLRDIPRAAPGEPRLVWRVTTNADLNVPAIAAVIEQVIEPEIRAELNKKSATEPMRLAVVRGTNATGQSHVDLLLNKLRWNGRSVAENGRNFRQFVGHMKPPEYPRLVADLIEFAPHIIVEVHTNEDFWPGVEKHWPVSTGFRPRYLFNAPFEELLGDPFLKNSPELRRRVLTVNTLDNQAITTKFVVHYNEFFSPPMTMNNPGSAPYDAFYVFAYAAASLGDQPITGLSLAAAIPRLLPPGDPIDVGPGGIYSAFYALGSGKNIDLQGAMTTLDFNLDTGDAPVDTGIYCSTGDIAGPTLSNWSGLVFRARSGKLEGHLRCP